MNSRTGRTIEEIREINARHRQEQPQTFTETVNQPIQQDRIPEGPQPRTGQQVRTLEEIRQINQQAREDGTAQQSPGAERFQESAFNRALDLYRRIYPNEQLAEEQTMKVMAAAEMSQYLGWSPEFTYQHFDAATAQYFGRATPHQTAWELISGSYQGGRREVQMGLHGISAMQWISENQDASPEEVNAFMEQWRREYDDMMADMPQVDGDDRNLIVRALMATARQIPRMERSIVHGTAGSFVAGGFGALIGGLMAGPPGAVKGWAVGRSLGFKATSVYRLSEAYAGGTFNEIMQLQGPNGETVDPRLAVIPSATAGLLAGLSEFATWQMIPGGREAVEIITGRAASNMFVNQVMTNTVANSISRYAVGVGAGVVNEIWQETAQVIGVELARAADEAINENEIDSYTWNQIGDRMMQIIEQSAMSYAVMAIPGTAVNMYRSLQPQQIAEGLDVANQNLEQVSSQAEQAREAFEADPSDENRANLERIQEQLRSAEVSQTVAQSRYDRVDGNIRQQLAEMSERNLTEIQQRFMDAVEEFNQDPSPDNYAAAQQIYERVHAQEARTRASRARDEAIANSAPERAAAWRQTRQQFDETQQDTPQGGTYDLDRVADREALGRRMRDVLTGWSDEHIQTGLSYVDILARRHGLTTDQYVDQRFAGQAVVSVDQDGMFEGKRGGVRFSRDDVTGDIQAIIAATETADFSTWIHELAHIEEKYMSVEDRNIIRNWAETLQGDPDYQRVLAGEWNMNVFTSEKFAEAVEQWFMDAEAAPAEIQSVLQRVAQFVKDVYREIVGRLTTVPTEISQVIERMVGIDQDQMAVEAMNADMSADVQIALEAQGIDQNMAQAIAEGAPGNDSAQAAVLQVARELTPEHAHAYAQALNLVEEGRAVTEVTEAIQARRDEARAMSDAVVRRWHQLEQQAEIARERGMEDAAAEIAAERDEWAVWASDPEKVNQIRSDAGLELIEAAQTVADVEQGISLIQAMENDLEIAKIKLDEIADTLPEEFLFQRDMTHPDEISDRLPTNLGAEENPYSERLIITEEVAARSPEQYAWNAGLMRNPGNARLTIGNADLLVNAGFKTRATKPESVHREFKQFLKDNLHFLMDQIPQDFKDSQRHWYVAANTITNRFADKYDLSPRQVAGVIAVLSPQRKWQHNVSNAERILDILNEEMNHLWDAEMEAMAVNELGVDGSKGILYNLARGKTLAEIITDRATPNWSQVAAYYIRAYDRTHFESSYADFRADGTFANTSTDRINWGTYPGLGKAIEIALTDDYEMISAYMGQQNKVRNFYNNILSPFSPLPHITIDTHAVAASMLSPFGGKHAEVLQNFGSSITGRQELNAKNMGQTGSNGLYYIHADAYREVANEIGGYQAREIQSITWEWVRELFPEWLKRSDQFQKEINDMWADARGAQIDATRLEIIRKAREAVEGSPRGRVPYVLTGDRATSYERKVPRAVTGRSGRGNRSGDSGQLAAFVQRDQRDVAETLRNTTDRITGRDSETLFQPARNIESELKKRHPGLELATSRRDARTVAIDMIRVPEDMRNQGVANEVITELTRWADLNQQTLALTPSADFGANQSRLTNFYRRHGFKKNAGKNRDFSVMESMVRPPASDYLFQTAPPVDSDAFKAWFKQSPAVDENGNPLTLYTGTLTGGFTVFRGDTSLGVWLSDNPAVSKTYSGTDMRIEPVTFDEIVADFEPTPTLDGILWKPSDAPRHGYIMGLMESIDPDDPGWTAFFDGAPVDRYATREEAVAGIREVYERSVGPMGPERAGIYEAYVSMQDPLIVDAEGNNWAEVAYIEDDSYSSDFLSKSELAEMMEFDLENKPEGEMPFSAHPVDTNAIVEIAREEGHDGVIFKNVIDPGGKAAGGIMPSTVYVAFESNQVKSVHNYGTFDPDNPDILYQRAYHGTPYRFESQPGFPLGRFDLDAIGTGEGAQAYGWGIYFAESQDVAKSYVPRDEGYEQSLMSMYSNASDREDYLSMEILEKAMLHETPSQIAQSIDTSEYSAEDIEIMRETIDEVRQLYADQSASLYRLTIPEDVAENVLIYEAPLSEQPASVRKALRMLDPEMYDPRSADYDANETGSSIYNRMQNRSDSWSMAQRDASISLAAAGIPGLKYLDQDSRVAGREATYNYVLWDRMALDKVVIDERNEVALNDAYTDTLYQESREKRTWQLKSEALIAAKMQGPMTGQQLLGMLKKNGINKYEMIWMGYEEFLSGRDKVSPEEMIAYIEQARARIEPQQVTMSNVDQDQVGLDAIYEDWITPVSRMETEDSYREFVLELPFFHSEHSRGPKELMQMGNGVILPYGTNTNDFTAEQLSGSRWLNTQYPGYISSEHFTTIESPAVHSRTTERAVFTEDVAAPDAPSSLLENFEENLIYAEASEGYPESWTSPDFPVTIYAPASRGGSWTIMWDGEDATGSYKASFSEAVTSAEFTAEDNFIDVDLGVSLEDLDADGETQNILFIEEIQSDWVKNSTNPMPFEKSWEKIMFRNMIVHAIENGYEGVGWTRGIEQDFRYGDPIQETQGYIDLYDRKLVQYANKIGKQFGVSASIRQLDDITTYAGRDVLRGYVNYLPITQEMRDSVEVFQMLFQSDRQPQHEAQIRQAIEEGRYVPLNVLQDYNQESWAKEEAALQLQLRQDALQADNLEDFLDFQSAMQTTEKTDAYYAELYNDALEAGLDRGEENARFLESISNKQALLGLLGELMLHAEGDLDGMHVSIVTAAKSAASGRGISDAHYNSVMQQIRSNPSQYRRDFAEILGDREAIQQLNDEVMNNPKDAEIDRLQAANRQLRRQNSAYGQNLKQQQHRTEMLERYARDIDKLARQREEQIKSQIEELQAAHAEEENYVAWLERAETRNDRLIQEAEAKAAASQERIASLREALDSARKEAVKQKVNAVQEYRQARESRDYALRLIKNIMSKPSISIDHRYAEQIRAIQSPLRVTTPQHIRSLRSKLPQMLQDGNLSPEQAQEMQRTLDRYSLKDWSIEELEQLRDQIKELRSEGRALRWEAIEAENTLIRQARAAVIESANPDYDGPPDNLGSPEVERSRKSGPLTIERLSTLTPARIAEMLDRYAKDGEVYRWLVREVEDATSERLRQAGRRMQAGYDKMAELGITAADMIKKRSVNGVEFEVQQLIGIHLYAQNEKAAARLLAGNYISSATIEAARGSLTQSELQFAEWLIESFEQEYSRLEEAYIADQNAPLGKEERYFPMMVRDVSYDAMPDQIADDILARSGVAKQWVGRGMTKERIEVADENQPSMRLDAFAIWSQMVNMQETYINSARTIKRLHKIFGDRDVQHAMIDRHGTAVNQWTRDYINKIAKPNATLKAFTALENLSRQLRSNVAVAALSFNPLTVLKQFPSIALAMGRTSPVKIVEAVGHMVANPQQFIEQIKEMDPYMANMQMDPILVEMRMNNKTAYERLVNKIGHVGMYGIGLMDKTVKSIIWRAAYEDSVSKGMSDADAIHAARRTVIETQPGGLIQDLPALATQNEGFRWLTMFSSQLQKIYGIATHDIPTAARRGEIGKALMMSTGFIVSALGIGVINLRRAPEDPEEAASLVGDALINMVPVFGPAVIAGTNNFPTRNPAPIDAIVQIARTAALTGDGNTDQQLRQAQRAVESVLFAAGAPTVQGRRILRAFDSGDPWDLIGGPPRERR